jgi:hypothetical protein
MDRKWRFRLEGTPFDIAGLVELFNTRVVFTKDDSGIQFMELLLPFEYWELSAANEAAEECLTRLNGIANVFHGDHQLVRIATVGYIDPETGIPSETTLLKVRIGGRSRVTFRTVDEADHVTNLFGDRALTQTDQNEHLGRALDLYGHLEPNWRGLYMILEAIEDGTRNDGGLLNKSWASNNLIGKFKSTANSFKALGKHARHGSVKEGIDAPNITLVEARRLIQQLLKSWIDELSTEINPV